MPNRTQIRSAGAALAIFANTLGVVYFPLAAIVVPLADTSGWLAIVIAFLVATPWLLLAVWLARQVPKGDFGLAVKAWLGPFLSKLFLLWFALYWLISGSSLLSEISHLYHAITLPRTPVWVLTVTLFLLVVFVDYHGFETCMRSVQALVLMAILPLLGFLVASFAQVESQKLMPLLGVSLLNLSKASYLASPFPLIGILFTLFLAVKVQDQERLTPYAASAFWFSALILATITIATIGVLGCDVVRLYVYPTIPLTQSVNVGDTLVGIELLVYPLWLMFGYIRTATAFVIASSSVKGLIPGLKQPYYTVGMGLITLTLALIPPNLYTSSRLQNFNLYYISLPFYAAIPLIALWVKIKGKREVKK